jgi:hypothetical protein
MAMRRRINADIVSRNILANVPTDFQGQRPRVAACSSASYGRPTDPTPGFPEIAPRMIADFVTPSQRIERAKKGKERVTRGEPCHTPIIPLRPAPADANSTRTTEGSGNTTEVPSSILAFDPENPASVKAVVSIVQAVLREMGIENVSLADKRRTKGSGSRQSGVGVRARAIRAQQALIEPREDCAWKVGHFCSRHSTS